MFRIGELFFSLLAAHALTDYVLQPPEMAKRKSPHFPTDPVYGPWWWWMLAHGFVNGLGVAVVTGDWRLGIAETVVHSLLDTQKALGWITAGEDQAAHLVSKFLWGGVAWQISL